MKTCESLKKKKRTDHINSYEMEKKKFPTLQTHPKPKILQKKKLHQSSILKTRRKKDPPQTPPTLI